MARSSAKKRPTGTLLLLVRHGLTDTTGKVLPGRARGLELSAAGRAQALAVAERIAAIQNGRRPVAAVYTSPLSTRQTASPIGKAVRQRVRSNRGLLECDFGTWTGAELGTLMKLPEWKAVQHNPSGFRFPDGESFAEMQTRITGTIDRIRAKHAGEMVVAVSHADPIKAALAQALGTPLDLFQRIVVSPCSVSAVFYGDSGPTVLAVNTTGDLATLKP